jgi:sugar O-acyltransferase (sialic acid O-acetyltransferase NeuD family)
VRDLIIIGAGGYGREVCQVVEDLGPDWNVLGFLDDREELHGGTIRELPVLGAVDAAREHHAAAIVVAVGSPAGRRAVAERLGDLPDERFPVLVHPRAWIGNRVEVGAGTVVLAGAAVSTDIRVGRFACLNKNCIVGHDAVIGDFTTISPGASISGFVTLGEGCDVGANSVVVQGHSVGAGTVVGAGAVVTSDLPAGVTAVGVPARAR